ncbi:hypothetical protein ACVINY_004729 [Sinorhizobium meliloti]
MSFQEREYRPPSRRAQQAYERGSASGSILAEMGGGQCVTIATAARVGLPCDIIDGRAQCVESRKELRFRDFRSAEFGIGHHERVSLDEEPHLKHTLVAKKTDGVSFFIEAAARIWKYQRHNQRASVSHDAEGAGAD